MSRARRPPTDRLLLGWVLALAPLAGIAWSAAGTPRAIVLAALFSGLCYVAVVVWIAHAAQIGIPATPATFVIVWGAGVAAPLAGFANDLLQAHWGASGWPLTVIGGPALEEAAKAGVLVAMIALWPTDMRGVRPGIVIGALTGLGFGMAENLQYFLLARVAEGPLGLVRAIAIRGLLEGPVHPVFAASTGAGFGVVRARVGGRSLAALVGFAAAVAQHALWNGVASPAVSGILCNGVGPSGACRGHPDAYQLAAVPLVVAAAVAPGILTLAVLARAGVPEQSIAHEKL
jgi:RsiW-degrading membrane proteinase PrsW (M82 family)